MSNNTNLINMLTLAAMVENLVERSTRFHYIGVIKYCLRTNGTMKTVHYME